MSIKHTNTPSIALLTKGANHLSRFSRSIVLRFSILLLTATVGCTSYRYAGAPPPSYDVNADLKQLSDHFQPAVAISNYYAFSTNPVALSDTNALMMKRNEVVSGRLVMINLEYLKWLRTVTADKQLLDTASDVLILSLNLAGTATGGAAAKTVLAAVSAGIAGSKTAIDKHYYYEKTLPALIGAMNAQRKSVLTNIIEGISQPVSIYTFEQALAGLQEYYQAGTLMGAVSVIQADSGAKEKVADEGIKRAEVKLSTVRNAGFVVKATQQRIDALLEKIKKLPDAAALDLEKNPPVQDPEIEKVVALRDPKKQGLTDPIEARQMLKLRAVLGKRSEQDLATWEAAVKSAE